jgi:hypothetical protein
MHRKKYIKMLTLVGIFFIGVFCLRNSLVQTLFIKEVFAQRLTFTPMPTQESSVDPTPTTSCAIPPVPQILSPQSPVLGGERTISWTAIPNPSFYQVTIVDVTQGTTPPAAQTVFDQTFTNGQTSTTFYFFPEQKYSITVTAQNTCGYQNTAFSTVTVTSQMPTAAPPAPTYTPGPSKTPTLTPSPTNTPTPVKAVLTPAPCQKTIGDANCDGKIDETDYQIWRCEYVGKTYTTSCVTPSGTRVLQADFESNGRINLQDFEIWRKHNGTTYAVSVNSTVQ